MAVILKNSTCSLCCKLLGEDVIAFPRMIENPADELLFADDAAFHRSCLERHPLYDRLIYRVKLWEEALNANLSSRHECFICKKTLSIRMIVTTSGSSPMISCHRCGI